MITFATDIPSIGSRAYMPEMLCHAVLVCLDCRAIQKSVSGRDDLKKIKSGLQKRASRALER